MALRAATAQHHLRVDALYGRFSLGSRLSYVAFLRAHRRALGALEPLADPVTPRLPLLDADLGSLGETPPPALPAGTGDEARRWGICYALEGSRLGGAMMARQVDPAFPKAYLSAAHEPGGWVAFQQRLEDAAYAGDESWMDGAIMGANTAFDIFEQAALLEVEGADGR